MTKNILYENEYFSFYLTGEDFLEVHLDSQPKNIQEKYEPEDILSQDQKLKRLEDTMDYFYNFWKFIETSGDKKHYTMYFNVNLIMINNIIQRLFRVKVILNSLNNVIHSNLKETYFKVENPFAKVILDIVFTFYTPIKKVTII
jgi:hypothetical protein